MIGEASPRWFARTSLLDSVLPARYETDAELTLSGRSNTLKEYILKRFDYADGTPLDHPPEAFSVVDVNLGRLAGSEQRTETLRVLRTDTDAFAFVATSGEKDRVANIGRGAFGACFPGVHLRSGSAAEAVCVKVSHPAASVPDAQKKLSNAGQVAAKIAPEHTRFLLHSEGVSYCIMGLAVGTAEDYLLSLNNVTAKKRHEMAASFALTIGATLQDMHAKRIGHFDIKLANCLFEQQAFELRDFDLAMQMTGEERARRGNLPDGNSAYDAPERLLWNFAEREFLQEVGQWNRSTGLESDVYSFGVAIGRFLGVRIAPDSCTFDSLLAYDYSRGGKSQAASLAFRKLDDAKQQALKRKWDSVDRLDAPFRSLLKEMLALDVSKRPPITKVLAAIEDAYPQAEAYRFATYDMLAANVGFIKPAAVSTNEYYLDILFELVSNQLVGGWLQQVTKHVPVAAGGKIMGSVSEPENKKIEEDVWRDHSIASRGLNRESMDGGEPACDPLMIENLQLVSRNLALATLVEQYEEQIKEYQVRESEREAMLRAKFNELNNQKSMISGLTQDREELRAEAEDLSKRYSAAQALNQVLEAKLRAESEERLKQKATSWSRQTSLHAPVRDNAGQREASAQSHKPLEERPIKLKDARAKDSTLRQTGKPNQRDYTAQVGPQQQLRGGPTVGSTQLVEGKGKSAGYHDLRADHDGRGEQAKRQQFSERNLPQGNFLTESIKPLTPCRQIATSAPSQGTNPDISQPLTSKSGFSGKSANSAGSKQNFASRAKVFVQPITQRLTPKQKKEG